MSDITDIPTVDPPPPAPVRMWDPLVRLTHWLIALAVVMNEFVTEGGSLVHIWIGYSALALLALRLVWGVFGTEEARFTAFRPSLSAALRHLGDMVAGRRRIYRSHNPLGALMVYALWVTLAVIIATGLLMESSPFPKALAEPTAAVASEDGSARAERDAEDGLVKDIHELAANLLLILAALHVAGVGLETRLSRHNLVRPMITGWTRPRDAG